MPLMSNGKFLRNSNGFIWETGDFVPPVESEIYACTIRNTDSVASLPFQPYELGFRLDPGIIPNASGGKETQPWRLTVKLAGVPVQISRLSYHADGSLAFARVKLEVNALAAGGSLPLTFHKTPGRHSDPTSPLHSSVPTLPAAVWAFSSWMGRPTTSTYTSELGPFNATLADAFDPSNSPWISRRYAGLICSEWVASRGVKKADNSFHSDFMVEWYLQVWGGTTGAPRYIGIGARTKYGWQDALSADLMAFETDMNFSIGGVALRGSSLGTTGWTDVKSFYGGQLFSFGTTGKFDLWSTATSSVVIPAKLQVIHNMSALKEINRVIPALNLSNNTSPWWNEGFRNAQSYTPGTKSYYEPDMGATGGRDEICWGVTGHEARYVLSHSLRTPAQVESLQQVCRIQALSLGSLPCAFYQRGTRGLVSYLPDEALRVRELAPTDWTGTYAVRVSSTFTRWNGYDGSHVPGFALWAAMFEGTELLCDLLYAEALLPGFMGATGHGFKTTVNGKNVGGVNIWGQTRSLGASIKAIAAAVGLGTPEDLNWRLANNLLDMTILAVQEFPISEDAWRGGGKFIANKLWVLQENDGGYKLWMHSISASGTFIAAALVPEERLKALARYLVHTLAVMSGGYNNVAGFENLWIGRAVPRCTAYTLNIHPNEGGTGVSRQPFEFRSWGFASDVTYSSDGQTITLASGTPTAGGYFTPRAMATPAGLTVGQVYYIRDVSGSSFKVAATSGGPAVTFTTTGVTLGAILTAPPALAVEDPPGTSLNSGSPEGYGLQVMAALKGFLHWVEDNPRVRQGAGNIELAKSTDPMQNYIEQAGWLPVAEI